jgi:hypothetical protein
MNDEVREGIVRKNERRRKECEGQRRYCQKE